MNCLFPRFPPVFLLISACGWLSGFATPSPAQTTDFSQIIIFGDSLSDSGNFDQGGLIGGLIESFAEFGPEGSFTNGFVWHEFMADALPIARAAPSNANGGTNYAWGGAKTDRSGEISDFLANLFLGQLTGIEEQVEIYLDGPASGGADPEALFILWGGGNDILDASSAAAVAPAISNIDQHLRDLAAAGADTFLVPNLPNLGQIPRSVSAGASESAFRESLTLSFNNQLGAVLDQIEIDFPVQVHRLDVFAALEEMLTNPGDFGFTNTTGTCPDPDSNCEGYLFWDDIHPTEAAHQLIGLAALDLLDPVPVFIPGDLTGDGQITPEDIGPFILALTNPTAYAGQFPDLDPAFLGDINGDGAFNLGDVGPFKMLFPTASGAVSQAVPEPGGFALILLAAILLTRAFRRIARPLANN